MFVSAFYLTVQATTGELSWASAGHPSPVLISQRRHLAELLQPTPDFSGRVLGLFDDPVFPTGKRILERGDRVVCFTDGIYEVDGARGESFGLGRLRKAFEARVGVPADRLLDEVIGEVQRYSGSGGFDDDACLLSIDFMQEDQPDDRRRAGASAEPEGAR
jgi:sigma-B regulation protein RsbU (phosphoserine phosphatase)